MKNREIQDALRAPTPHDRVNFRVGYDNKEKGYAVMLAYIDARYVQDKLDDVVGSDKWEVEYIEVAGNMFCAITIRWPDGQVTRKMDVGIETDVEKEKGQASDAFKRAAVMYGIGRDLYGYPKHFADLDKRGKVPFDWKPTGWGESSDPNANVMSADHSAKHTDTLQPISITEEAEPEPSMKQAERAQIPAISTEPVKRKETLQEIADRVSQEGESSAPEEEEVDERGLKTGIPPEDENVIVKNLTNQAKSQKGAILYLPPDFDGDKTDYQQTKPYWVGAQFIHDEVANMSGTYNVTMTRWIAEEKGYEYEEVSEKSIGESNDDDLPF